MGPTLHNLVDDLTFAASVNRKCTLLIGAGCSVSAGIPAANGFVDVIRREFPNEYKRARPKTYARCMARLPPGTRRDLIKSVIDKARMNWGHVAIAQLMVAGYVDSVLTTNFDQLLQRACAMCGIYPAVYDFASSQMLKPEELPERSIFHLHGQKTGFILLNTAAECKRLEKHLGKLFDHVGRGKIWIVVGYSGENDPVFDRLAEIPCFERNLYGVSNIMDPPEHLQSKLLRRGKRAHYLGGLDSDAFFVEIARGLECFPPD